MTGDEGSSVRGARAGVTVVRCCFSRVVRAGERGRGRGREREGGGGGGGGCVETVVGSQLSRR